MREQKQNNNKASDLESQLEESITENAATKETIAENEALKAKIAEMEAASKPKPKEKYKVPKGEEKVYHISVHRIQANRRGVIISKPEIKKVVKPMFGMIQNRLNAEGEGTDWEILHKPK